MAPGTTSRQEKDFDSLLDSLTFKVYNSELTAELRKKRRSKADKDDLEFAKIYFPNIFDEPYNAVHRHIAALTSGFYTVSGFRRSGKTAFAYVVKLIKKLSLGVGGILNLNLRTIELSKERTAALIRLIKRNRKLCYDYDIKITQDKKGFYIVNNTYLIAGSYETGLRSILDDDFKRIRVSINDDLYNKSSVTSEKDNEKVKNFIQSEVYGMMEPGGLAITFGNSISENCPIVLLKKDCPENHFSLPALDSEGNSNWPSHSVYTKEYWERFKGTIPFDVWMGEYMDEPFVKGEIFDPDWIRGVNVNTLQIIASISAIDPSFGKSQEACFKGIATLGQTNKNEPVMLDMYLRKEDYSKVFDYADNLREKMPNWKVLLFENDFSQFYIAEPYYEQWKELRGKVLPIVIFSSKTLKTEHYGSDKASRIMNLVHPHQTGRFLYNEAIMKTEDYKLYYKQYLSFGKAEEKLDGLDAAATAFIMIKRYLSTGSFKPLGNRQMKNNSFINSWHNSGGRFL
jgi:hypothetical protein